LCRTNNDVFGSLAIAIADSIGIRETPQTNPEILSQVAHEFNVRSIRAIGSEAEDSTKRKRVRERRIKGELSKCSFACNFKKKVTTKKEKRERERERERKREKDGKLCSH